MAVYDDSSDEHPQKSAFLHTSSTSQRSPSMTNTKTALPTVFNPYYTGRPRTPVNDNKHTPINRQEIIRKIKSRESRPTSPELGRNATASGKERRSPTPLPSSAQLPQPQQRDHRTAEQQGDNRNVGLQIERPRSALHRGDFWEKPDDASAFSRFGDATQDERTPSLSTSPVAPWHPDFPTAGFRQAREERQALDAHISQSVYRPNRSRATSHASLAASFSYQAPTSPLVQSSRPDTPEPGQRQRSRSPDKSRRHTFSPRSFQHFQSALDYPASARRQSHKQPPPLRAEKTFPYQAHQPRRSLNAAISLPQTPGASSRRPSISDSPLHHAPMVGSYEESILRGRMSTTPSKPLNFVAQIGVLGKGDCKPSLRCPVHASIPFPAVFYSYGTGPRSSGVTDQPSPYVGLVDLENTLPSGDKTLDKRRQRLHHTMGDEGSRDNSRTRADDSASDAKAKRRLRLKQKRRSGSPKAPPGGSYRIPQQGQLQIIIKNPNKTAVKLFLVPYDLSDMEAGQKTFIRQRSYSAGPILDMPLSSRKNLGTDRPEAALNASDDPSERPMLRYLIHLHICCPSKGRYFLYKSIRVVFANRVPDGKEKLRNEVQLPEPRYTAYKPGRDSNAGVLTRAPSQGTRRWASEGQSSAQEPLSSEPGFRPRYLAQSLPADDYDISPFGSRPMQPLPFHVQALSPIGSRPISRQESEGMDIDSERSQDTQSTRSTFSSSRFTTEGDLPTGSPGVRRRLDNAFEFDHGRARERRPEARNESLLSRRLKDLAFQREGRTAGLDDG